MDRDLKNRFHFLFNIMKNNTTKPIQSSSSSSSLSVAERYYTSCKHVNAHTQTLTTSHRKQNKTKNYGYIWKNTKNLTYHI